MPVKIKRRAGCVVTGDNRKTTIEDSVWSDGSGGWGSWSFSGPANISGSCIAPYAGSSFHTGLAIWPASFWPNPVGGPEIDTYLDIETSPDPWTGSSSETNEVGPEIGSEYCQVNDPILPAPAQAGPSEVLAGYCIISMNQHDDYYTRHAQTKWHLQTGGKSGRQSLWDLSATASEILNKRAVPPYDSTVPMQEITDKTQISIGTYGNLDANGNLYVELPDDVDRDVTPQVSGPTFYTFTPGATKYHCYFTAYAEEPNPGGGRDSTIDWWHFTAGHAWWCLSSDAPVIGLNRAGISIASLTFLNQQVGYFPAISSYFSSTVPVVGELRDPGNGSRIDGQFTWEVGFSGLKGGLDFTANLSRNPGLYSLWAWPHTCVTTTIQAGAASGVLLPNDQTPQNFGIDLDAMWVLP